MRIFLLTIITIVCQWLVGVSFAQSPSLNPYYGPGLCANQNHYICIKTKRGDTWKKLFPDELQRDLVQRINRFDTRLWAGRLIAIPRELEKTTLFDASPLPLRISKKYGRIIIVDQEKLAWGAYNRQGQLVKWGPISSGKDYCPDVKRNCSTITGIFYVFHKKDGSCVSKIFPVGKGGAKMPHCMFFYRGYALHGSDEVLGRRDSHGCVRIFRRDAQWLNENFVHIATDENDYKGTKIIIQPVKQKKRKG